MLSLQFGRNGATEPVYFLLNLLQEIGIGGGAEHGERVLEVYAAVAGEQEKVYGRLRKLVADGDESGRMGYEDTRRQDGGRYEVVAERIPGWEEESFGGGNGAGRTGARH